MDFDKISPKSMDFLQKIAECPDEFNKLATSLICEMEMHNVIVPEFSTSYEWLNTSDRLTLRGNLLNKICVIDFFTYCCINCMHVLPDLHALEQKYTIEDGVAVIGVHSAKFKNEKLLENILSAVLRYGICHPVVNDCDAEMWNAMSIQCWPTFVITSPEGKVLLYLVGEGHRETLLKFVGVALDFYNEKGLIRNHSLPIMLAKDSMGKNMFNFPGKISVSNVSGNIAISDTGNHQIVILDKDGVLIKRIGSGEPGHNDGSFSEAMFFAPQGLTWQGNMLFVADTENHIIRQIDLNLNNVVTIAGVATKQGNDKEGGAKGVTQEISSPWDVVIGPAPGSDTSQMDFNCLYIAMAGTHQIWCFFLQDGGWLKKGNQQKNTCLRLAGNGNEENRNNSYPHKAAFAQPSGLTCSIIKDKYMLYVADSESSSIRSVEILNGAVKACVGAERDPMNLFAYGDVDGKGVDAKLQHPLAVAFNSINGLVYIADSYNHKIKVLDPLKLTCSTLAGTGNVGLINGSFLQASFNEPGDLEFNQECTLLYVADTNNHVIRVLDMERECVSTLITMDTNTVSNIMINDSDEKPPITMEHKSLVGKNAQTIILPAVNKCWNDEVCISVKVNLPTDLEFTVDVESTFQVSVNVSDNKSMSTFCSGTILKNGEGSTTVKSPKGVFDLEVEVELLLFVCTEDKTCLMKQYRIQQPILHLKGDLAETNPLVIVSHLVEH